MSIKNYLQETSWRLYIIIVTVGLFIILTMSYGFHLGNDMAQKHTPLIDATMEIKLETTIAHLRFEELISGDRPNDLTEIQKHLHGARWYAKSMLEGGENPEGKFIPLTDPVLISEVHKTLQNLDKFNDITQKRLNSLKTPDMNKVTRQYDKIYDELINQVDRVETILQNKIIRNTDILNLIQIILTIVCFISILSIAWIFHNYDRRRAHDLLIINTSNEHLQKALNEVKTLKGIIPICSYCHSIRDDKDDWYKLEQYLSKHSDARFSHSICPDCYPKILDDINKSK